jgi:hypothetical protein
MPKAQPFGATPEEAAIAAKVVRWRASGLGVRQIEGLLRYGSEVVSPRTGRPVSAREIRSALARHRAQLRARTAPPELPICIR